jgi:hypothetical protein
MLSLVPRPPFGAARGGRCASENLQRLHWSGRHRPARDSRAASIRSLQLIAAALIADWGPRMLSISRITILSCRIEQRVRNEATSIFLANPTRCLRTTGRDHSFGMRFTVRSIQQLSQRNKSCQQSANLKAMAVESPLSRVILPVPPR